MPVEHEVISITPNWQVLTFSTLQKAKNILLEKFHKSIVESPEQLAQRYTIEQIQHIMQGYKLNIDKFSDDRVKLAHDIWPQFIMFGRRTSVTVFNNKDKGKTNLIDFYYLNYTPRRDLAKDLAYLRLPPQGKVVIDLAVKYIPESGVSENKWYKILQDNAALFKTRQAPWRIWMYYRKQIFSLGFITPLE